MPEATVGARSLSGRGVDQSVLLTLRNVPPFKGQWCVPGGHIDPNETAADAVVREVKEETGLDFEGKFFGAFDEIFPELGIHNVALMYTGAGTGTLRDNPAEVKESRWFPLAEAQRLPLAFGHNEVLRRYAA
jgi:8-oxo-dGTP diphosphatase